MDLDIYKALFFLVSGLSIFFILGLLLRLWADESESIGELVSENSEWRGVEYLEVVEIIQEVDSIKSFRLRRLNDLPFPPFKAGQFISFQIGEDTRAIRSYSISSSDKNRDVVQVSVKKLETGIGSSWFHNLGVGQRVKAYAPSGHFFDNQVGEAPRIYVAGGIGITPLISMIRSNIESAKSYPMILFYGARTASDFAFHEQLQLWSRRHSHFKYIPVVSNDPEFMGEKGYIDIELIRKYISPTRDVRFYLCGPGPMTQPLIEVLEKEFKTENIFYEKFASPVNLGNLNLQVRKLEVTYLGERFKYNGNSDILSFLEQQGRDLPFACRTGVCGSCKCKIHGPHDMLTDSGLTREEIKNGYSLACVSIPLGDIEVSLIES